MDVGVQRKIDQAVGPLICRALSLFSGGRAPSEPPKRILIILLSEMGSLVLGCSMFRRIREKYPQASIHAMVFEKNREILDLLEVIPPENVMTLSDALARGARQRQPCRNPENAGTALRRRHRLRALRPREQHLLLFQRGAPAGRVPPAHDGRALPGRFHQPARPVQPLPPHQRPVPGPRGCHRVALRAQK